METLFPLPPVNIYPEGFDYVENFISAEDEEQLLEVIRPLELHAFDFHGFQAKRRVISFGYDYSFDKKSLAKGREIPPLFEPLIRNVAEHLSISATDFREVLVTEYPVGSVINWHRDAFPFDIVAGISLLSDCTFKLRPHDLAKRGRKSTITIAVKHRSLYILSGDSRYHWQHSIAPVPVRRYSITLRTLKKEATPK